MNAVSMKCDVGRRGSALLLVLWAVFVVGVCVMGVAGWVGAVMEEEGRAQGRFATRLVAESAAVLAAHPQMVRGDPLLEGTNEEGVRFHATFRGEFGRLNINVLLADPKAATLKKLFDRWQVPDREATVLLDRMRDWVDGDDLRHLSGAEADDYKEMGIEVVPPNRKLASVQELDAMPGIEWLDRAHAEWRELFTVWGEGALDLNEAESEAIEIVCGVTSAQARAFLRMRDGPDGASFTEDDVRFKDMEIVRAAMGVSPENFAAISSKVTLDSAYRRILSEASVGRFRHRLEAIVRVSGGTWLTWEER
jgi:type II secretory pathway component PulK